MSVCLCITFVVFTDSRALRGRFPQTRDLWKRANVGERVGRVSSHAVSRWSRSLGCCGFRGMLWVRKIFFLCVCFFRCSYFLRTHTACCTYESVSCLIYLSTSAAVRTGCQYLISLSVYVSVSVRMCNIRRFYCLRELFEADFHKSGVYGNGRVWANAWDVFRRGAVSGWSRSPGCCKFRRVFSVGRSF